jgi:hypothetical protein
MRPDVEIYCSKKKMTHVLQGLVLLFQLGVGLEQRFLDLVEVVLQLLHLLLESTDLFLSLLPTAS